MVNVLSSVACTEDAHRVEIRLQQLTEVRRLPYRAREPRQAVSELCVVPVFGLRRACLHLEDGCEVELR